VRTHHIKIMVKNLTIFAIPVGQEIGGSGMMAHGAADGVTPSSRASSYAKLKVVIGVTPIPHGKEFVLISCNQYY